MRHRTLLLLPLLTTIASLALALPQDTKPIEKGRVQKRSYFFKDAKKEMTYSLFVPKSYDADRKHPLIVLLHGLGSNPSQVMRYAGITKEAEKRGYIVVAPYGYNDHGWYGSHGKGRVHYGGRRDDPKNLGELSEKDVMNVLAIVRKQFRVDDRRIYLMGHSMGGGGTMHLAVSHSKIWAALAPLAPAFVGSRSVLEKIRHLPVMVVTGEKDRLVKVQSVRRWIEKMEEFGIDHIYKEIPGGNHFDTIFDNPKMIAEVYDFFDSVRKGKKRAKPGKPGKPGKRKGETEKSRVQQAIR